MKRTAIISDCGLYRYSLTREWDPELGRVLFVMLNPSTADARSDDPTIWRCIAFAMSWGFGSLEVVNLFAYRATCPHALVEVADPIGPENDRHIGEAVDRANLVIAAWGCRGGLYRRDAAVRPYMAAAKCLGVTKAGHPRHPLYVKGNTRPMEFIR